MAGRRKIFLRTNDSDTASRARKAAGRAGRSRLWAFVIGAFALAALAALLFETGVFRTSQPVATKGDANAPEVTAKPSAYATRVDGVDQQNLPYSITAIKASQNASAEKTVDLETVEGKFNRTSGETLNVTSAHGAFDSEKKVLNLEGNVRIESSTAMTATMDKAEVNVETKQLQSKSPVKVVLPDGEVTADHLQVDNNGEKIKFTGRVKASFGASPGGAKK
jgi:lipopolysaccharide export system protein LptC